MRSPGDLSRPLALTGAADNRWFLHFLTRCDHLTALPRLQKRSVAAIRGVDAKTLPRFRAWQRQSTFGANIDLVEDARGNAPLIQVYRLNTELKALWFAPTVAEARLNWQDGCRLALETRLTPVIRFANTSKRNVDDMLSSVLQGMNNRIKGTAHGYRDALLR